MLAGYIEFNDREISFGKYFKDCHHGNPGDGGKPCQGQERDHQPHHAGCHSAPGAEADARRAPFPADPEAGAGPDCREDNWDDVREG